MNDESHSHKKATAAGLATLLLAYVGSYLAFRLNASIEPHSSIRVIVIERGFLHIKSPSFLNYFYAPLSFLDLKATRGCVVFTVHPDFE